MTDNKIIDLMKCSDIEGLFEIGGFEEQFWEQCNIDESYIIIEDTIELKMVCAELMKESVIQEYGVSNLYFNNMVMSISWENGVNNGSKINDISTNVILDLGIDYDNPIIGRYYLSKEYASNTVSIKKYLAALKRIEKIARMKSYDDYFTGGGQEPVSDMNLNGLIYVRTTVNEYEQYIKNLRKQTCFNKNSQEE